MRQSAIVQTGYIIFGIQSHCGSQLHKKALIFRLGLDLHSNLINGSLFITKPQVPNRSSRSCIIFTEKQEEELWGAEVQAQKEPGFLPSTLPTLQLSCQIILEMNEERPKRGSPELSGRLPTWWCLRMVHSTRQPGWLVSPSSVASAWGPGPGPDKEIGLQNSRGLSCGCIGC